MTPAPTHRCYTVQPSGCYHLFVRAGKGKWKVSACDVCGRPLEHYKAQDGSYGIRHQCDREVAERGTPPPATFEIDPTPEVPRSVGERLSEEWPADGGAWDEVEEVDDGGAF